MSWAATAAFPIPLPRRTVVLLPPNPNQRLPCRHHRCYSTSQGSPDDDDSLSHQTQDFSLKKNPQSSGFWMKWKENSAEMGRRLAKVGLAAVLAYGLFDAFTYTTFFVLAFLGYEKSTGNNPAANIKALLGIVILMWTGNNVTRPFRVAGAAALAPFVDRGLRRIQKQFNFPNLVSAFALVVAIVAALSHCCWLPCFIQMGKLSNSTAPILNHSFHWMAQENIIFLPFSFFGAFDPQRKNPIQLQSSENRKNEKN